METYEIGGIIVNMTTEQAAAWNKGNITEEICEGAYVTVPCRSEDKSFVRDGGIEDRPGLPYEEFVSLWKFIGGDEGDSAGYREQMKDSPANLI